MGAPICGCSHFFSLLITCNIMPDAGELHHLTDVIKFWTVSYDVFGHSCVCWQQAGCWAGPPHASQCPSKVEHQRLPLCFTDEKTDSERRSPLAEGNQTHIKEMPYSCLPACPFSRTPAREPIGQTLETPGTLRVCQTS